jgi:hypothetical protein
MQILKGRNVTLLEKYEARTECVFMGYNFKIAALVPCRTVGKMGSLNFRADKFCSWRLHICLSPAPDNTHYECHITFTGTFTLHLQHC